MTNEDEPGRARSADPQIPTVPWDKVPFSGQLRTYARLLRPSRLSPIRFVIFGQGRSGSTLLSELLTSHPDVECDREILDARVRCPDVWVRARATGRSTRCFGYKVKPHHITGAQGRDLVTWLNEQHRAGWRIVHLVRRDAVKQLLSNIVRQSSGATHRRDEAQRVIEPVEINVDNFATMVRARLQLQHEERQALSEVEHCSVIYEDDLRDQNRWQVTGGRVFAYLVHPRINYSRVV